MTSNSISVELRRLVIQRASARCKYCQIYQNFSIYTHEVDHIIAVKRGAILSKANLTSANLRCANLACSSLDGANLTNADFTGAVLDSANLTNVEFAGINLDWTILTNTNFRGAKVLGVPWEQPGIAFPSSKGALFLETLFPDGQIVEGPYYSNP